MTELEKKIKAKIPGEDTGIEIRRSLCSICTGSHCGLDCYVKDGKIIRVEGTLEHPFNRGKICVKGGSQRSYVYREDRIKSPLRRVGERGEGKFERISWDEAYATIAEQLNRVKEQYSPHSVAFLSGYSKWYRPIYQHFANVFGSVNYGTDDCNCAASKWIADKVTAGGGGAPDRLHANTFLGWNFDGYYSKHNDISSVMELKKRGGKVIIIDIRKTPAAKNLADIFLHIRPGTDGALALGMAKLIIDNGWADKDYIEKYTYGFDAYREMVQEYTLEKVQEITGLDPNAVYEATKLYATNGPACTNYSASAIVHHVNGFNAHRAILCLSALTGNFGRPGGQKYNPGHISFWGGFPREHVLRSTPVIKNPPPRIGELRFPLWGSEYDELQGMDLQRQMEEEDPYPIKAIFALGMNAKMYPQTKRLLSTMKEKLDFFVDTDLFMTMTAKYADIVLPACTSVERSELKTYQGGKFATYTKPVIEPLYESKSDVDILFELAEVMKMDDPYLKMGYEGCVEWAIEGCGLTLDDLKKSDLPLKVPVPLGDPKAGNCLENGFATPTGKFEFYSTTISHIDSKFGLDPLPSYRDPLWDQNDPETKEKYPFYLCTGARMAFAVHSRTHETPWLRSLRPDPLCEINREDAARLGLKDGDAVQMSSPYGEIRMRAKVTGKIQPGVVLALHGYTEANVAELMGRDHLDPYSGYPGHKGMRCNIRKYQEA